MEGSLIDQFKSGKNLGFGFGGHVNKCRDGKHVIKRFRSESDAKHEYEVASRLAKCPLFVDHMEHSGKYVRMELLEGKSPTRILDLSERESHALVRDTANGLAFALKKGVIPWDLTSGNILISNGATPCVKIFDFGSWGFYEEMSEWFSKARAAFGFGGGFQPLGAGGSVGLVGDANDLWESFGGAFGRISKNQASHHQNIYNVTLERLKGRSINNRTREIMIEALSEMGKTPAIST